MMETMNEILKGFLLLHDALGAQSAAPDKEEFDKQHRKIWTKCGEELNKRLVKLQAKDNPTPAEIQEIDDLLTYLNI